ncbi:MAG TPA: SCO family protein [Chromatiales bacterium]|nr:SCO family protein [Chromatiales bacterium]
MRALLLALALAGAAAPAAAFDVQRALTVSQAAIGRTVGDHVLVRSDGTRLRLSELAGRPLLVSLVYTGCYQVCPTTTRQLLRVARLAREALGPGRFRVLVVGFDTAQDTPEAMRAYARRQGAAGEPDWIFASADEATVRALARDLGFVYERAPQGFDHLLQVTLLDGSLRVRRQLYGDALTAPQLVEPLKQIVYGEPVGRGLVAEIADRVRLFCTTYDPATGAYRFDYSLFIGLAIATLILLSTLAFLVRELRRRGAS